MLLLKYIYYGPFRKLTDLKRDWCWLDTDTRKLEMLSKDYWNWRSCHYIECFAMVFSQEKSSSSSVKYVGWVRWEISLPQTCCIATACCLSRLEIFKNHNLANITAKLRWIPKWPSFGQPRSDYLSREAIPIDIDVLINTHPYITDMVSTVSEVILRHLFPCALPNRDFFYALGTTTQKMRIFG